MSIAVSEALDFSPKEISAGQYILRLVNSENSSTTNIAPSSTVNTDFLLPNQVINLSRTFLNYELLTTDTPAANKYMFFHSGFMAHIDGITLSTSSGVRLVEINDVPYYTKMVWRTQTSHDDFETFPKHDPLAPATVPTIVESGHLLHKTVGGAAAGLLANPVTHFPSSVAEFKTGSFVPANETATCNWVACDFPYDAPANYCACSLNAQNAIRVRLPLKMFYGTLLALDKDLYFGEQLRLTIRWNLGKKMGWTITNGTAPYGAQAAAADNATAADDFVSAPTISGLNLRVAVENNDAVAQTIKSRVAGEGITINMPYVYNWKGSTSGSGTDSFIRKLNRSHGIRLLRMISGVFGAVQTGPLYTNMQNFTWSQPGPPAYGNKWSSYRDFIDSRPLCDDLLTVSDQLAYLHSMEKLKGSLIKGVRDWMCFPVLISDFSGVQKAIDYPKTDSAASGLDLSQEREYMLQINTTVAGQFCYLFAVTLKQLHISSAGVAVM